MESVTNKTRMCLFCGEEVHYNVIEDDGRDWMGHQRGESRIYETNNICSCKSKDWRRMCLNCEHFKNGYCYNQDTIDSYNQTLNSDFFDVQIVSTIKIKDSKKHCNFWNLNRNIGNSLFKD
jgi:hypothetical protein